MAQYLRPDGDVTIIGFTAEGGPSNCYECLDETSPSDSDYINGDADDDLARMTLSTGTDPVSSTGHVMRWRWRANRAGTPPEKGSVTLLQGGTTPITSPFDNDTLPTSWTDEEHTLSAAEADAITDYTDLQIRFKIDAVGVGESVDISWFELEIPDAPGPAGGASNLPLMGVG